LLSAVICTNAWSRRWGKLTEQQRQKARADEHVAVRAAAEAAA
jgi:hypothetical protein